MPYEVRLAPQVGRVLRKTRDRNLVQRLVSAIGELATTPRPAGSRKLEGQDDLWQWTIAVVRGRRTSTQRGDDRVPAWLDLRQALRRGVTMREREANSSVLAGLMALGSFVLIAVLVTSADARQAQEAMMIRISEIQVDAAALEQYKRILNEEAEASVRLEPGVVAIFPMFQKEMPTEVRILEIYASPAAYQAHLETPHFKHYKSSTLHMVKSLKLVDMTTGDVDAMAAIFKKVRGR